MYETGYFDPKPMTEGTVAAGEAAIPEDGFSHTLPTHNSFEENLRLSMEELQQMDINQNGQQCFDYSSLPNSQMLLNLFHLPSCSGSTLLPSSSISFSNPTQKTANYQNPLGFLGDVLTGSDHASGASVLYDPLFHLNLPPQPPMFRGLFQSLPNGYGLPGSRNGSDLFGTGGGEEREGSWDGRQFENGVLEFTRDMACIGNGRVDVETKPFDRERQRRQQLNDKFKALRSLVPNPTKVFTKSH
jgi:hypothetical protein